MATQEALLIRHKAELVELVFELNMAEEYTVAAAVQTLLVGTDELHESFAEQGIGDADFEDPC